jgi:cytidyltransferase-like protein
MPNSKILDFASAPAEFDRLRAAGKKIVQCHGTFDLIHPGHIYHLEEARGYGDVLVVTITAEKFVNKGPGRPYFNDQLRSKSMAALACVDYVIVVPHAAAVEAITCVKPHIYCKGREYSDPQSDVTGNIHDDLATVEKFGGQVHYLGSVVFSSTKLINNYLNHQPEPVKEMCRELSATWTPDKVKEAVDDFASLRIVVVGDVIFDRYTYLKVQGLTSKNRILSGRHLYEETQAGGSLAIFNHLKQFTPHVKLVAPIGTEPWVEAAIREHVTKEQDFLVRSDEFTTVVKQRFVEPIGVDKELSKLFSVNFIDGEARSPELPDKIIANVLRALPDADVVVVADFGHGTLSEAVRRRVEKEAPFLALNCQTNSNNHGFNIISRQYQRADCFSLDEQELLLSCAQRHVDFTAELAGLKRHLNASSAWLTRGAVETIGLGNKGAKPFICVPLESTVLDTVGAGDAFFSVALMAAAKRLPIEISTFLGQLAGAQSVKIVGNLEPISKSTLLKSAMSMLKF